MLRGTNWWAGPLLGVLTLCGTGVCGAAPRPGAAASPELRLSLLRYGYRPVTSAIIQREGYSMSTVDLIDEEHVLVTFSAHKLIPRLADDREGDQDRLIKAVVLHLPDGKVVHETEWRTHDRNQYLWPMQHGHFLLREANTLWRVSPMHGFARERLLDSRRPLEIVDMSPAGDMVLVETAPEHHIGDDPTVPMADLGVDGTFYSIHATAPILRVLARVSEPKAFSTPFNAKGFLGTVKEDREHWGFDFHPFGGQSVELAGFTSTCRPLATFVSDGEFVATGCRGGTDRRLFAGFDLAGTANWVFTVDDTPVWAAIGAAPGSGRFATRVTSTTNGAQETDHVSMDEVTGQQVRVYSFRKGTELLRVSLSPLQRSSQNFGLSPDGLRLAVLRDGDLEVYRLPPPTADEVKDEKRLEALTDKIVVRAEKADAEPVLETQQ